MSSYLELYESGVAPARERFARSLWVTEMLSSRVEPDRLELFLIHFSALGARMTAPVEGWIRRAGECCLEVGLPELGRALVRHARAEADHDKMMIQDAKSLVARRNTRGQSRLDCERVLAQPDTPGIARYVELHEQVIASPEPFAQIAIEFEIEGLSVRYGPKFIERCVDTLGPEIKDCMSFVEEHAALDVGHSKFNASQLENLLARHPEFLETLVRTGAEALDTYANFLDDCVRLTLCREQVAA